MTEDICSPTEALIGLLEICKNLAELINMQEADILDLKMRVAKLEGDKSLSNYEL